MGMLPSHIRLFAHLHKHYGFQGPVCSLGCQDIWATAEDLRKYFDEMEVSFRSPQWVQPHNSRTFASNEQLALLASSFVHARTMFEAFGMREYQDIDKFDSDCPSILHDLNLDVPDSLVSKFGLVLDGGTAEHIFDLPKVLENMTKMLRIGGCIVHISSFSLDHGFYGLSPVLYYDYYSANGFSELKCFLMEMDYSDIIRTYASRHRVIEYEYGLRLDDVVNPHKQLTIFFAARKSAMVPEVIVPTQGTYAIRGNRGSCNPENRASIYSTRVPVLLQPILRPLRPALRAACRGLDRYRRKRNAKFGYF